METKLKITLINHSDNRGGAAVVTRRLMEGLCAEGVDARMVVMHKDTDSLRVDNVTSPFRAKWPFLAEHAHIFLNNGYNRENIFKISTAKFGQPVLNHPWVKEADVVIINWINQGMMSFNAIRRLAAIKPVIWTMHDQWNMTGICHYLDNCDDYQRGCTRCPMAPKSRLAEKIFQKKKKLYFDTNITFVAVSQGLARECKKSPLLADIEIKVIPNAFPVEQFPVSPVLSRRQLRLPADKKLIVMGAARLDDAVKNLPLALEALNQITTSDTAAVFFGKMKNPDLLQNLKLPYVWLGAISDHKTLSSIMAHANVVLSTSVWETLPGTIVEGIAAGAVGIATDYGGQNDIIDSPVTGYLVPNNVNASHLAQVIDQALAMPFDIETREQRHIIMAQKFSNRAVAKKYINLCQSLIAKH